MSIQPYQQRVSIGTVQKDGSVLASSEFIRYISQYVYERIGGSTAMSNAELGSMIASSAQGPAPEDTSDLRLAIANAMQAPMQPVDDRIEYLETRLASLIAETAELRQSVANLEMS